MTSKNKIIIILAIIFCSLLSFEGYSQFPDPAGDNGSLKKAFKTIYEGNHACWPWATAHKTKTVYSRRLQFRAHFYYNCWYYEDELNSTAGWNKLGK